VKTLWMCLGEQQRQSCYPSIASPRLISKGVIENKYWHDGKVILPLQCDRAYAILRFSSL